MEESEKLIPFCNPGWLPAAARVDVDKAIRRVLDTGVFLHGPETLAFEREFAEYCGVPHCILVSSGTAALALAARRTGLARVVLPGICPAAVPCALDCERIPWRVALSPIDLYSSGLHLHVYGDQQVKLAQTQCWVDDCSQAVGSWIRYARPIDALVVSHYPSKPLGAFGDAGSILVHDDDLAVKLRSDREYGWDDFRLVQERGKGNLRCDELQAAVLRVKLRCLDELNAMRHALAETYFDCWQSKRQDGYCPIGFSEVVHLLVVSFGSGADREKARMKLEGMGIGTGWHYPHLLEHPSWGRGDTEACFAARCLLSLPLWAGMMREQVRDVCDVLRTF
mgnify:CR=1 FL=1